MSASSSGYLYAGSDQFGSSDGAWTYMDVADPYLAPSDSHTLGELAVESTDGQQIVEVGWTVDRGLNGDTQPHLFVYHWVNGQETCYNGCGYVATDFAVPGMALATGKREFGIEHMNGRWYIGIDSKWIGYFPDSLWGNSYTKAGLVQAFGEVSVANPGFPCTDMGNGDYASNPSAASILLGYFNGPGVSLSSYSTNPSFYSIRTVASDTIRYGGLGAC